MSQQSDGPSKRKPGAAWKHAEEHVLPKNNIPLVFLGLMLSVFLASLDQTIVATALPTIVRQLGGGRNYSWVGSSYLLASATIAPLLGKLSDLIGRKPILYSAIVLFIIGSALCGAAQNLTWLIIARAIQGLGGGGIIQLVNITISDIVSLQQRGKYGGLVGATWGVSSIVGPLLGGALTDHVSWRWCFYINLPTGAIAGAILFFFLNLNPHQGRTFREHVEDFDFIGLLLMVAGVICALIGFTSSETSWSSAETISLLSVGFSLLVIAGIHEGFTKRSPIIPPRLFKTRTTAILLIGVLLHAIVFMEGGAFYLPLYYQILGSSATGAGAKMLAFSLGASVASAVGGMIVSRVGEYRITICVSFAVFTLGTGLMIMLDETSSIAEQEIYPLIAALGLGSLFQVPLIGLQAAMPIKDMATSTSTFGFLRTMGSTIGVSIGQAIITSTLPRKAAEFPSLADMDISSESLTRGLRELNTMTDTTLRDQIRHVYSSAVSMIWLVNTPIVGFAFALSLFLRKYTLKRTIIKQGDTPDSAEKGDAFFSESSSASSPDAVSRSQQPTISVVDSRVEMELDPQTTESPTVPLSEVGNSQSQVNGEASP